MAGEHFRKIIQSAERLTDFYVHVCKSQYPAEITVYDDRGRIVSLATRWLADVEYTNACGSRETFARYVIYLLRWMRRSGSLVRLSVDEALRTLTRNHIKAWIDESSDSKKLKASTIHQRESVIATFIEWMEENKIRDEADTPYRSGKLITKDSHHGLPKAISEDHFIKLLKGYHNESERCMLHGMYDTGMRISEVCRLRNRDLPDEHHFDGNKGLLPIRIQGSKGRGGHLVERNSIISRPVLARIRKYHNSDPAYLRRYPRRHDPDNLVFLSATGRELSRPNVHKQLKRAAARAGLDPESVRTHTPRHSFSFEVLMAHDLTPETGTRYVMLTTLLGHRDPNSTKAYSRVHPEVLEATRTELFSKYEAACRIAEATTLAPLKHTEKRGH